MLDELKEIVQFQDSNLGKIYSSEFKIYSRKEWEENISITWDKELIDDDVLSFFFHARNFGLVDEMSDLLIHHFSYLSDKIKFLRISLLRLPISNDKSQKFEIWCRSSSIQDIKGVMNSCESDPHHDWKSHWFVCIYFKDV